jgi:hypothetical protein
MTATEARAKVAVEPCACVRCGACGGSGTIWLDFRGRYLGNSRCDDLDEMEPCDECSGGIVEVCERCQLLEEMDNEAAS